MAAIDKIYLETFEQYEMFRDWCNEQPNLKDKYGTEVPLSTYLYKYKEPFDDCRPVFQGPYYADAYLIRNCPFDFVQKELMVNYGHWSQEKIDNAYEIVSNRKEGDDSPFFSWLTLADFEIVDGVVTMPNLEKSDYELIKEGKRYATPYTTEKYEVGKHFRCLKHPRKFYNKPFGTKSWFIDIETPEELPYMWYHRNRNTWDFSDEFVKCDWTSNATFCFTIKALKRLIIKWQLPVGTKIFARGRYIGDEYVFIVTK